MRADYTWVEWQGYGITVLVWAPLFAFAVWKLKKQKITAWKFRALVSLLGSLGVAPSLFVLHGASIIFPAVTALSAIQNLDSSGIWFAALLGVLPISLTALLIFSIWSFCESRRSREKNA